MGVPRTIRFTYASSFSPFTNPLSGTVRSAISPFSRPIASIWMSYAGYPYAYRLPTRLPTLVPTTMWTGTRFASRTLITPTWANPLAAPAPRTSATLRGTGSGGNGFTSGPAHPARDRSRGRSRTGWREMDARSATRRVGMRGLRSREQGDAAFRGRKSSRGEPVEEGLRRHRRGDDRVPRSDARRDRGGEGAPGAVGIHAAPRRGGEQRHLPPGDDDVDPAPPPPREVPPLEDDRGPRELRDIPRTLHGTRERGDPPVEEFFRLEQIGSDDVGTEEQPPVCG